MISFVNYPAWLKPEVFSFLTVRWYAVMYIVSFVIAYFLIVTLCKKGALGGLNSDGCLDLVCYTAIGVVLGGRIASCLIYTPGPYYWTHPWMIFWPFRNGVFTGLPGMSYHGGIAGGIAGGYFFGRKYGFKLLDECDVVFTCVPLGYTCGRIGNFINGELWGRCTGTSYGMIFPNAPAFPTVTPWVQSAAKNAGIDILNADFVNLPRHPSQLYEAFFEGIVLFLILWFVIWPYYKKSKKGPGFMTGCYFIGYSVFRFIIEYFREPDADLGFIIALGKETEPTALFKSLLNISMGQILCILMTVPGILMVIHGIKTSPCDYNVKKKKDIKNKSK